MGYHNQKKPDRIGQADAKNDCVKTMTLLYQTLSEKESVKIR